MTHRRETDEVVIVADLHMSSGRDPVIGRASRLEDFHRDRSFAAFLDWRLRDGRTRARHWRLLILGDFLDFTRVELGSGRDRRRLDMSEGAALAKLERVAAGHPQVFEALRRVVRAGVPIDMVPGNHDLELLHAAVQSRLRGLLADGSTGRPAHVSVHPWIFHIPGLMYAEHGHQHHDINRIPPMASPGAEARLEPPLGSHLAEWMSSVLDAAGHDGPLQPSLEAVANALWRRPLALAASARMHTALWHGFRAFMRSHRTSTGGLPKTTGLSRAPALDPQTVVRLQALHPKSPVAAGVRMARRLAKRALASNPHGPDRAEYMRTAAAAVHDVLTTAGEPAGFYVFGHTHVAETKPLGGRVPATYLNPGTWSSLGRDPTSAPTFVEVSGAPRSGRVRLWDEAAARAADAA